MAIRFHFGEHEHTGIVAQPQFLGNPELRFFRANSVEPAIDFEGF